MFLGGKAEDKYVVQITKQKSTSFRISTIKHRKVLAAFLRPKDMKGNSKGQKL
jgi:hypothetical protein